jgi:hypothetical protein
MNSCPISDLLDKTLVSAVQQGEDRLVFQTTDGETYTFLHNQDCCETVFIESIVGDLADLIGSPILTAEESTSDKLPEGVKEPQYYDTATWTFYKFATRKGYVDIRWFGSSNGYYSEEVTLYKSEKPQ